eukprot:GHVT01012964.1.p1 GENE.GHVT01012964.1~~GHVT01012964.1.p1  ORF type:complete len:209 (+),score=25.05 GHVT01012964.1:219-845(+)
MKQISLFTLLLILSSAQWKISDADGHAAAGTREPAVGTAGAHAVWGAHYSKAPRNLRSSTEPKQNKKTVALDIDEVLAQFIGGISDYHNETYGTSLAFSDFTSYRFSEVWGGSNASAVEKVDGFFKSKQFKNVQVVPGAKEAVARLSKNFNLVVVTSRQLQIKEKTIKWLELNFPRTFSNVYFANHWTKPGYIDHGKKRLKQNKLLNC